MMSRHRLLAALALALGLGAGPAPATEVAYPPGSRIGLAAPAGMVASRSFLGFEDRQNSVAIVLVALPAEAFTDLDRSVNAEALRRQGVVLEAREALPLATGKAFLVVGRQEIDRTTVRKWILVASTPGLTALVTVQMPEAARSVYPDASIRAALASVVVRGSVPDDEQLGLLPFKVGELAGFRVAGVMPGRALMLSDAAADVGEGTARIGKADAPHMLLAAAPGAPAQPSDRDNFARNALATVPNLKDVRLTVSEPMRLGGHQGHQILATARDANDAAVTVGQWLRFGGGGYLQMIGVARVDAWKEAYPRFRAVRDGIEPR
jgi:hypothetical protein